MSWKTTSKLAVVLSLLAVSAVVRPVSADWPKELSVLDPQKEGPSEKLLYDHLLGKAKEQFAKRRETIANITTPDQFRARQKSIRETLFRINGEFPEKTPLNPQITGRIERDGFVIEKVIYESRPQHYVTANLYLPKRIEKPVPGVLIPCGHSRNGKAAGAYQSIAISLAMNGIAALVYDPFGQGERHQHLDEEGDPEVAGTTEHTLVGVGGWLVGLGAAHYRIWDGIRSIDYLASRNEIDADRLGCTGNSGGGTMTSYLMAFDDRIYAAAPSCYLTTLERLFETLGPQDAEQNFPGQTALGIDHADYIAIRAPKPTLMCVATRDFFDIDGAWQTFREAKGVYGMLGHTERMDIIEFNDKHGFSHPRRQAAMRFMRRWLLGKDDNPPEPELTLSTDEELQCTKTGEVLADFDDAVSVFELNVRRATLLANQRAAAKLDRKTQLEKVKQLAGIRDESPGTQAVSRGKVSVAEDNWQGSIEKILLVRKGELPIPALLYRPERVDNKAQGVVYVSERGKEPASDGTLMQQLNAGNIVLAIDVRGFGETTASKGRNRGGYFGTDFRTALMGIHLNRPLVGQRAEEILEAVDLLKKREGLKQVKVVGVGLAGPAALHAAAVNSKIDELTLIRSIESWSDVVATPLGMDQLTNVVPFTLETYDLPDLIDAIAPRKVTVIEPVDALGAAK